MRQHGSPVVITDKDVIKPDLVSLGEGDYDERWLQDLLCEHPDVLPIYEIEPTFAPLVSLGTEIGCAPGSIDNLFISPSGALTIVETKLWRNPEARRQVVAQIIDYAQALSHWSYEDLESAAMSRIGDEAKNQDWSLYAWAQSLGAKKGTAGAIDEKQFVDSASKHLAEGRFLLLIVGDGIRTDVESMVDYLQATPQLHFTLALVELAIYRLPDRQHLVVPRTTARIKDIPRATVQVEVRKGAEPDKFAVDVRVEIPDDNAADGLTDQEFRSICVEQGTWSIHERLREAAQRMGADRRLTAQGYSLYLRSPDGDDIPLLWGKVNGLQLPLWRMWPHNVPTDLTGDYRERVKAIIPSLTEAANEPSGEFPQPFDETDVDALIEALQHLVEQIRLM